MTPRSPAPSSLSARFSLKVYNDRKHAASAPPLADKNAAQLAGECRVLVRDGKPVTRKGAQILEEWRAKQ